MAVQPESILIVGLGNPILTDDSVGWKVAQAVRERLNSHQVRGSNGARIEIVEACVGGLSLAEMLVGHTRAIVIDAMVTGHVPPGTVSLFKLRDLPGTLNMASAHDTNLATALRAMRRFEAQIPDDAAIDIVGIEAQDVWTFGEGCTPEVMASVPEAAALVLSLIVRENSTDYRGKDGALSRN